jgi:mono/diheme cytochrome c family protein
MKIFLSMLVLSCSLGPALAQQPAQQPVVGAPAGNIERGKRHFTADGCYQCHGATADGAAATGPKLSRTALPYDAFVMQLRRPSAEMPPYEAKLLPEQAVADIYAFVKSLPASPEAKNIPLLMGMGTK